jgi:hypothetical protein
LAVTENKEEVRCASCGALNIVTYRYAGFGPANQERETGGCAACGKQIASAKCLSIGTELAPAEGQANKR